MATDQRKERESSKLRKEGWTNWEKAMVPDHQEEGVEPREPKQAGFMSSSIKHAFPLKAAHCGIYEWQARRSGQPNRVVYVGSTCRKKQGLLKGRILEYCRNGDHKEDFINDALRKGYELWVRAKIVEVDRPRREDAEAMENTLLDKYDYAWNKRCNGPMRNILP